MKLSQFSKVNVGNTYSLTDANQTLSKTEDENTLALSLQKLNASQSAPFTKTKYRGDRFIPSRTTSNFNLGCYKLHQHQSRKKEADTFDVNLSRKKMRYLIGKFLYGGDINSMKMFSYRNNQSEKCLTPPRSISGLIKTPESLKSSRKIPQNPSQILHAHDVINDRYLQLIDWSFNNKLAIALGNNIFLYDIVSNSGTIFMCKTSNFSSLAWAPKGHFLATGTSMGNIALWDCNEMKVLFFRSDCEDRITSLAWNSETLTSGGRDGKIVHYDLRQRNHKISIINAHVGEICGLKWSPDGRYLASGGRDHMLHIWSTNYGQPYSHKPIFSFDQHKSAVKAIAWCPWQSNLLISGGNRTIRIWNCNTGSCVNKVDVKSRVGALLCSPIYRELISGHELQNNDLVIWKYPTMAKVTSLKYHTDNVLGLALSPDNTTVVSLGGDERLCFWDCFQPDSKKKKHLSKQPLSFINKQLIR